MSAKRQKQRQQKTSLPAATLAPVSRLKGVGPRMAEKLAGAGIEQVQDLLFHLPLRYQDRTRVTPIAAAREGEDVVIEGEVRAVQGLLPLDGAPADLIEPKKQAGPKRAAKKASAAKGVPKPVDETKAEGQEQEKQGDVKSGKRMVFPNDLMEKADYAVLGLDLQTGDRKHRFPTKEILHVGHHHRCYRNKATERFLLMSRRGVEFIAWSLIDQKSSSEQ